MMVRAQALFVQSTIEDVGWFWRPWVLLEFVCHESSGLSPKMMQQMRLERLTSRRVAKDLEIMWSESQRRNGLVEVFLLSVFTSSIRPQELWYVHETPAITFNAKRRARDSENSGAFFRFLAPH